MLTDRQKEYRAHILLQGKHNSGFISFINFHYKYLFISVQLVRASYYFWFHGYLAVPLTYGLLMWAYHQSYFDISHRVDDKNNEKKSLCE